MLYAMLVSPLAVAESDVVIYIPLGEGGLHGFEGTGAFGGCPGHEESRTAIPVLPVRQELYGIFLHAIDVEGRGTGEVSEAVVDLQVAFPPEIGVPPVRGAVEMDEHEVPGLVRKGCLTGPDCEGPGIRSPGLGAVPEVGPGKFCFYISRVVFLHGISSLLSRPLPGPGGGPLRRQRPGGPPGRQ